MFSSSLFRKTLLLIAAMSLGYAGTLYVFSVPFIKETVYRLEEESARTILDNIHELVRSEHRSLAAYRQAALEGHKRELKNITMVQESFLLGMHAKYASGELSLEEAQERALEELRHFKYGNNDYLWVANYDSVLISHPDPELHGADFSEVKDVRGGYIVPPMVQVAREKGEGYTSYWWRRLGEEEPTEKLTYSRLFPKWDWVIGTGVYVDDVEKEVERRRQNMIREIRETLESVTIARTGYMFIFDSRKRMVSHPSEDLEGESIQGLVDPKSGKPIADLLMEAAHSESGRLTYKWDSPEDPGNYVHDKISWVRYFPGFDWYIAASVYQDELNDSAVKLRNRTLAIFAATLVLGVAVAGWVARRLLVPVKQLSETAEKVRHGDLSARCPVSGVDEIGRLARTFNDMVARLDDYVGRLDAKVEERTREAEEKNQRLLAEIAERRRTREALIESEEKFKAIFNNIDVGIYRNTGKDGGEFLQANPALARMHGFDSVEELRSVNVADLYADPEDRREFLLELTAKGAVQDRELLLKRKDESRFWASCTATVRFDADGGILWTDGVIEDITRRKRAADELHMAKKLAEERNVELSRAYAQLKEVDKMKTDFLSTVSHELRTPLTSILGFAEMMSAKLKEIVVPGLGGDDPALARALDKVTRNVDIIVSESERLTKLINDVLDIAKMEAGRIEWELAEVDVAGAVNQAVSATSSLFEARDVAMRVEIEPGLPRVFADHDRLVQVLINLISNAAKFTEQGSVTIRAVRDDDRMRVEVEDTGPGIPESERQAIFEKFKQIGDTLTDKPKGTGLGLPICKQIVEYHNGEIWVESAPGGGAVFAFTLPAPGSGARGESAPDPVALNVDDLTRQLEQQVAGNRDGPPLVLVVDDDRSIRELLREHLEDRGYEVMEAGDGVQALESVKNRKPDLVTLDVMMPGMSGFDVAAVLRHDPASMDIPIMIISIVEDRARGYQIGVDRYFTKPLDTERVLAEIDRLAVQGASQKKVLVVDENASLVSTLSGLLSAQGYRVVEAHSDTECAEAARNEQPHMIIVSTRLSSASKTIRELRREQNLENVYFVLLDTGEQ